MSALGQKQIFAVQMGVSALPPKADVCEVSPAMKSVFQKDKCADALILLNDRTSAATGRHLAPKCRLEISCAQRHQHFRSGSKADICSAMARVRFGPIASAKYCSLSAQGFSEWITAPRSNSWTAQVVPVFP